MSKSACARLTDIFWSASPADVAPVLERAVAPVDEERAAHVPVAREDEDVGAAVAVEVVEDAAAEHVRPAAVEPDQRRDVHEPAHVELRAETARRDQVSGRDLLGILAERHVGDVQEPAHAEVVGALVQVLGEPADRLARALGALVDGLGGDREDAARRPEAGDAVLDLASPQRGDAPQRQQVGPHLAGETRVLGHGLLEPRGRLGESAVVHVKQADERLEHGPAVVVIGRPGSDLGELVEQGQDLGDPPLASVPRPTRSIAEASCGPRSATSSGTPGRSRCHRCNCR